MKTHLFIKNTIRFTCIALMLLSVSCVSRTPQLNYQEIIRAALALEMDIELKDNHRLYIEASQWMGTPYKYGGNTKAGIDCSGLTCQLYRKVFKKRLKRTANEQRLYNCRYVSKMKLKEGDLVFFHNGRQRKSATHVGIYLKDGKFIHASSNGGVIVSSLNETYYKRIWMQGGRVY